MTNLQVYKPKEREVKVIPALPVPDTELLENPEELFLFLTSWTCPYGHEEAYYGAALTGLGFRRDGLGNWWKLVGKSTTCFMAHLDTCDDEVEPIRRVIENGKVKTDGKTILGADDRAGVTALLYLQHKEVPGLYYLFCGEESGCIGSKRAVAKEYACKGYQRAISFDRRGTTSIITRQCGTRTCSDEFAWQLSNALNAYGFRFSPDAGGAFTDSREFAKAIPECTNISVGYQSAHTNSENQDLSHLDYLCEVCAEIDWEGLEAKRDPSVVENTYSSNYRRVGDQRSDWRDNYRGSTYYAGSGWEYNSRREKEELTSYGYSLSDEWGWDNDATLEAIDKSLEALDRIAAAFVAHQDIDPRDISDLVVSNQLDTVENITLLLETLHHKIKWVYSDDDDE